MQAVLKKPVIGLTADLFDGIENKKNREEKILSDLKYSKDIYIVNHKMKKRIYEIIIVENDRDSIFVLSAA